jgi:hypothetical protein
MRGVLAPPFAADFPSPLTSLRPLRALRPTPPPPLCPLRQAISAAGTLRRAGSGGSSAPDLDPEEGGNAADEAEEDNDPEGRGGGAAAAGAAAAALAGGPSKLVPLDLWILLALLGGRRGKEADKILRAKISDGGDLRCTDPSLAGRAWGGG